MSGDSDVQSLQVFPGTSLPSAVDPVIMSCSWVSATQAKHPEPVGPVRRRTKSGFFAFVKVGEIFADHEAVGIEPGAVAYSIARIGGLIVVGRILLHTQVCAPRLIPLPHGSRQSLANLIRACQTAQVAGFTLGARNKKTHARGWGAGGVNNSVHTAGGNNRQRRDCKQRFIKFHKILLFKTRFDPEFHICNAESGASPQRWAVRSRTAY